MWLMIDGWSSSWGVGEGGMECWATHMEGGWSRVGAEHQDGDESKGQLHID